MPWQPRILDRQGPLTDPCLSIPGVGWFGRSLLIAAQRSPQAGEAHFESTIGGPERVRHQPAAARTDPPQESQMPCCSGDAQADATERETVRNDSMGEEGFEPPKAIASRFTACPLWPLGYSPLTSPNQGEYCTGRVGCDQRLSPARCPSLPGRRRPSAAVRLEKEPPDGLEPSTCGLQASGSSFWHCFALMVLAMGTGRSGWPPLRRPAR